MQASLGNSKMSDGDNEDLHFADTVKGSDWGCDQVVARMFVHTAPKAIRELASWGFLGLLKLEQEKLLLMLKNNYYRRTR